MSSEGELNPIDEAPAGDTDDSTPLRARIASLEERLADAGREIERLRSENARAELRLSLERLSRANALTKQEAAKVRNTIAYQLGRALIQGFTSWSSAIALPGTLLRIQREAKRRGQSKSTPGPKLAGQLAGPSGTNAGAWCHPYVKLSRLVSPKLESRLFVIGSPLSGAVDSAVALTLSNLEYEIARAKAPIVRLYVNRNLTGTGFGNMFDFEEMQGFRRFLEIRKLVRGKGGRVEIIREDDVPAPLLTYLSD